MAFHKFACRDQVGDGEMLRVETGAGPIAICNVAGDYFAISDNCTHEDWPMSGGWLEGHVIECALHAAKFDVRTGCVLSPPATCPLQTFPVRVVDNEIQIDISVIGTDGDS
jgi:nitrite reductase/ring-hydroxylating ferredoxin subunit